jgi:acyl-CoA oxidase
LSLEDIMELKDKFWELHTDPIGSIDGAASTLLSIHYNLFIGTLGPYADKHPAIKNLTKEALAFRIV